MADEKNCSKCDGSMTMGFIIDHGHYNTKQEQIWIEGAPESSFWKGLKTSGRAAFTVRAFRCAACGFLEFYTTDDVNLSSGFSELFGG